MRGIRQSTIPGDDAPVLVLNETRKTLLASRLRCLRLRGATRILREFVFHPGDGIWVESCRQVNTSGLPAPLDLLFLDADHRVVAKVPHVPPGARSPEVPFAEGVLELPAGTILSTRTEVGDHILIESIHGTGIGS